MGTRARGHSKRDDVANKGDRRRSHTTRTCTDEVRGHQQKRRSETTAVREALRHRTGGQRQRPYANGPARSACPSPAEKTARGSDSEAKATANLMAAQQLSWIFFFCKFSRSRLVGHRVGGSWWRCGYPPQVLPCGPRAGYRLPTFGGPTSSRQAMRVTTATPP